MSPTFNKFSIGEMGPGGWCGEKDCFRKNPN